MDKSKQDQSNGGESSGSASSAMQNGSKRSSMRMKSTKQKVMDRRLPTKGRSQRIIFKQKNPLKGAESFATIQTSQCIFYQGQLFQSGDIVSVVDQEDGLTYYAQCKSFLTDTYCKKSVVLTWLLPVCKLNEIEPFEPRLFYLGPDEDCPRSMEYVTFVCHLPTDYYTPKMIYPVIPLAAR